MKKIGFLSFGHWNPEAGSPLRTAGDTLLQSIDLAVAAEELGVDGAYYRVHHFARQQVNWPPHSPCHRDNECRLRRRCPCGDAHQQRFFQLRLAMSRHLCRTKPNVLHRR